MLKDIESLLSERGPLSTIEIAACLGSTTDAVSGMLELLQRKGYVRKGNVQCGSGCAGCSYNDIWIVVK